MRRAVEPGSGMFRVDASSMDKEPIAFLDNALQAHTACMVALCRALMVPLIGAGFRGRPDNSNQTDASLAPVSARNRAYFEMHFRAAVFAAGRKPESQVAADSGSGHRDIQSRYCFQQVGCRFWR